jgi:hypothetical protein
MYCPGPSFVALEGMRKLWCGWWQREGNISTIQNESIDWVHLCSVCKAYMLVSFSICKTLPNRNVIHRADPVHITEHRLSVAGFSPQRYIFKVDISCVHRISSGLLIGSVAFTHSTSSLPLPRPAGLQSSDPNSTYIHICVCVYIYICMKFRHSIKCLHILKIWT